MLKYFYSLCCSFLVIAAMAQPPKQALAFYNNGLILKQKGMPNEAMASFKKAVTYYKKYDSAYLQMGMLYASMNNADSAIAELKHALQVNPAFSSAYIAMGNIYRDYKSNPDEAINNYMNAFKIDSTEKTMLYGLAWCYNVKHNYREAVKYAVKALEYDNNYNPAYNELGHAYHQLKAYEECIEQFKKNLAISVNDLPLLYSAYCHMELKHKEDALKIYEELNKRNTKMAAALKRQLDTMQ